MAKLDLQAVIACPPEAVFAELADLSRRPELDPTVSELAAPAAALEPGTAFSGRGTFTGSDSGFDGIVTALDPSELFGTGITAANGARLVEEWRLRPVPSGTLVNYHAELRLPGGLLGRILDRVMVGGGFRRQRGAVLAQAKKVIEASGDQA